MFGNDEDAMKKLTNADVEALHLTAPGACQADAQALYGRIQAGELLGAFNGHEQDAIWEKICSATTDRLVPSLFSFFEDLKYLKGPTDCMKRLVRPKRGETIFSALESAFLDSTLPAGRCPVQVSRTTLQFVRVNAEDRLDLLYRQLWLMAFREYRDMPNEGKKKLAGPRAGTADEAVLFEFASLAGKFGFQTEEIQNIVQRDPDRAMICRFLTTVRKPDQYKYENLEDSITQVIGVVHGAQPLQESDDTMDLEVEEHEKHPKRCGVPNDDDQLRDKSLMFLNRLHGSVEQQDMDITSFFVQRSCYFYLFGKEISVDLGNLEDLHGENEFHPVRWAQTQRDLERPTGTIGTNSLHEHHQHQMRISELESQGREYHARLEVARREAQQIEATLQSLLIKQQEQQDNLEHLGNKLSEKQEHLHSMEEKIRNGEYRVQQLQDEETQYTTKVEELKLQEADYQQKFRQLEELQGVLKEKIRINRLIVGKHDEFSRAEQEWKAKLEELGEIKQNQQEKLQELELREREKNKSLEFLDAETKRQTNLLNETKAKVDQLMTSEKDLQLKNESLTVEKKQLQSSINKLTEKDQQQRKRIGDQQQLERLLQIAPLEHTDQEAWFSFPTPPRIA